MKTKILLLITIVSFLIACESNDNSNLNITSADVIGTWNLSEQTIEDGSINITSQGVDISATFSGFAKDINFTYSFSETPNKLSLQGKYTFTTNVSFLGQNEIEEQEIDTDLFPIPAISWSLNGNSIIISENGELPTVMNVEEFSANYLKLKGEINETITENGESITTAATITIVLEK